MQCLNHKAYSTRCFETESFVAHNANLGKILEEILGDKWNMIIVSYKDGDILLAHSCIDELSDIFYRML